MASPSLQDENGALVTPQIVWMLRGAAQSGVALLAPESQDAAVSP